MGESGGGGGGGLKFFWQDRKHNNYLPRMHAKSNTFQYISVYMYDFVNVYTNLQPVLTLGWTYWDVHKLPFSTV